jgi:hypothetical protein
VLLAALVYGWWFTDRTPFSSGATHALLVVVAALIVAAVLNRRGRSPRVAPSVSAPGAAAWIAITIAVVVWELLALHGQPRSAHPTISSFVETAEGTHVVRLAFYAVWLAFGWVIAS